MTKAQEERLGERGNYSSELQLNGRHWEEFLRRAPRTPLEKEVLEFLSVWTSGNAQLEATTSGSTGNPVTHTFSREQAQLSASRTLDALELHGALSVLLAISPRFIAGKLMLIRGWLAGWNMTLSANPGTPFDGASGPYDFTALVPLQLSRSENLPVKKLLLGGGAMSEAQFRAVPPEVQAWQSFAMTETLTHTALRRIMNGVPEPYYTALPGVRFDTTEEGALVIHDEALLPGGPLVTRDWVELIGPERFAWKGRLDFVIKSGGIKIAAEEVEDRLQLEMSQPFFATGINDDVLGQRLVIVVEKGGVAQAQEAINRLSWPPYGKPKGVLEVEKFVYSGNGKILRRESLRT